MSEENTANATDDGEEFESTGDEFRALYRRCDDTKTSLLKIANRIQPKSPEAADVLRQVAGNVLQLLQDTVAACGGAFEAVEGQIEDVEEGEGGEGLSEEDAVDFYRTVLANIKLVEHGIQASDAGEQRDALEALKKMNDEMRRRVVELSDMEEADLLKAAEQEPESESAEPEGEPETDPAKVN
jgi:hypothetical protein